MVVVVPTWLPHPDALVSVSGVFEVVGAIGLLFPVSRQMAAWGLVALLAAVFPANVEMLVTALAAGRPWWVESLLWTRLPIQPLLMWTVYRYAASKTA